MENLGGAPRLTCETKGNCEIAVREAVPMELRLSGHGHGRSCVVKVNAESHGLDKLVD